MNTEVKKVPLRELQPDIPTPKLKRSWQDFERRRQQQAQLKRDLSEVQLESARSSKTTTGTDRSMADHVLSAALSADSELSPHRRWSSDSANIPGFRFRANGDRRVNDRYRLLRSIRPLSGLSRHVTSSGNLRNSGHVTSRTDKLDVTDSHDNVLQSDGDSNHQINKSVKTLMEEDAALRLRKVQQQLGLTHCEDLDIIHEKEQLDHTLKVLSFVLNNSDSAEQLNPSQYQRASGKPAPSSQKGPLGKWGPLGKPAREPLPVSPLIRPSSSTKTSSRPRCVACQQEYRSDVRELMVYTDPLAYKKPRWRSAPSGRYVPPPLNTIRLLNPALYSRAVTSAPDSNVSLDNVKVGTNVGGNALCRYDSFAGGYDAGSGADSATAGGGEPGSGGTCGSDSCVSLQSLRLKHKNSLEVDLLRRRMSEFMETIPKSKHPYHLRTNPGLV